LTPENFTYAHIRHILECDYYTKEKNNNNLSLKEINIKS